jgi:hypothetical protein
MSLASSAPAWPRPKPAQVAPAPLRRGRDAVPAHDLPDGAGGDLDAGRGELAVDPAVSPPAVLAGQARDQGADGTGGRRAPAPLRRTGHPRGGA